MVGAVAASENDGAAASEDDGAVAAGRARAGAAGAVSKARFIASRHELVRTSIVSALIADCLRGCRAGLAARAAGSCCRSAIPGLAAGAAVRPDIASPAAIALVCEISIYERAARVPTFRNHLDQTHTPGSCAQQVRFGYYEHTPGSMGMWFYALLYNRT